MATSARGNLRYAAQGIVRQFVPEQLRNPDAREKDHLELLAEELGVRHIVRRPLTGIQDHHPGVDAMLVPIPDGYSVVVNDKAPITRQRYSMAHELAHIMLLCREAMHTAGRGHQEDEERLCDAIAAELLMPEEAFTSASLQFGHTLKDVPRLAGLFGTSLTATTIRLWELLTEPCQIICWKARTNMRGAIAPAWQMRNEAPGPRLPLGWSSQVAMGTGFLSLRESWSTLESSATRECLLVEIRAGRKRYVQRMMFDVESVGFGSGLKRAALSLVYLSRTGGDRTTSDQRGVWEVKAT